MKLKIEIPSRGLLADMPEGKKVVEIEADSPAECMFAMQRRGCSTQYIKDVLSHMAPIWGKEFAHWYAHPDKERMQKDLIAVHGAYGYDGPRWD